MMTGLYPIIYPITSGIYPGYVPANMFRVMRKVCIGKLKTACSGREGLGMWISLPNGCIADLSGKRLRKFDNCRFPMPGYKFTKGLSQIS